MRKTLGAVLTTALLATASPAVAQEADVAGDDAGAVDIEQVLELHDAGLGWGAIARLEAVADHLGIDAEELLAATPYVDGEPDFDFGGLLDDLDKDGRAALHDQVKSYKALIKDATKALKADDHDLEGDDEQRSDGKAALLADAFGMDVATVLAMNEDGVGYGAIFKLAAIAAVTGTTVEELVAAAPRDEDGGIAFGELKKSLSAAELDELTAGPKTFGQLVSAAKKAEKAAEKSEKDEAKAQKKADKAAEKSEKDEAKAENDHHDADSDDADSDEGEAATDEPPADEAAGDEI